MTAITFNLSKYSFGISNVLVFSVQHYIDRLIRKWKMSRKFSTYIYFIEKLIHENVFKQTSSESIAIQSK